MTLEQYLKEVRERAVAMHREVIVDPKSDYWLATGRSQADIPTLLAICEKLHSGLLEAKTWLETPIGTHTSDVASTYEAIAETLKEVETLLKESQ